MSESEFDVVERAREIDPTKMRGTMKPAQIAKRLIAQGWEVRVTQAVCHEPAVLFMSDSEEGAKKSHVKGEVRYPAHDVTVTSVVGVKRATNGKIGLIMDATWLSKGGFAVARTLDPYLGYEVRVGFEKPRAQNDIEREDGITPPLGLGQWLDIIAPTEASKKKAAERAAAEQKEEWNG